VVLRLILPPFGRVRPVLCRVFLERLLALADFARPPGARSRLFATGCGRNSRSIAFATRSIGGMPSTVLSRPLRR
jgi:hypothetical protein